VALNGRPLTGGGLAVPGVPGGLGLTLSMQIGPDGIFLTGGIGAGVGAAVSATLFPTGSPVEGISSRVTVQGGVPLPSPLPPVGGKAVYSVTESGEESLRAGIGVGLGLNVSVTPVTQTKCIAFCRRGVGTISKSSR
jgi:hypothetical protein